MSNLQPENSSNQPCPCQSGAHFQACCQRYISGDALPETPELLMRSRYSAYVHADLDYIERTTQADARPQYDFEGLRGWAENSEWLGLKIHDTDIDGASGRVRFTARYRQNGNIINHSEDSKFVLEEGRWFFVHGRDYTPPVNKTVGRNDPCLCGSGKKFKKCCLV